MEDNIDFIGLVKIATHIYATFWNQPSPSTPTNDYIQSEITKRKLEANLAAFCLTFSSLFLLASSEAIETHEEEARAFLSKIWDEQVETQDTAIAEEWFIGFICISIISGVHAPCLQLYSMKRPGSLDNSILRDEGLLSHAQRHSSLCTHWFDLVMG